MRRNSPNYVILRLSGHCHIQVPVYSANNWRVKQIIASRIPVLPTGNYLVFLMHGTQRSIVVQLSMSKKSYGKATISKPKQQAPTM